MAKERKTINVSLQSKKYLEPINKILNEWEADSLNLSTQICENLLLVQQLKNSVTFGNILAVYELIERVMKVYDIQDNTQLEQIFSEIISIDHAKLGQMVTKLTPTVSTSVNDKIVEQPTQIVEIKPTQKEVQNVQKEVEVPQSPSSTTDADDTEIPLDFLFNS